MNQDNFPVLIGVGEITEQLVSPLENASSEYELAAAAAQIALQDASPKGDLAKAIDAIVAIRTFPDSSKNWAAPFGGTNNFPRSIAKRIGANPRVAVYSKAGGNYPQAMVNEWSEKLADGRASVVLLAGAEAIASTRAALKQKIKMDWSEAVEGDLEDRGTGLRGLLNMEAVRHKMIGAPSMYGLLEMARKHNLGASLDDYSHAMGEVMAPLSKVAADNPFAMFPREFSAAEIAFRTDQNPYIALPYTKAMVAKDRVNQAAAVLMTTVGKARELGVDPGKWVYLHAYAEANEKPLFEREDLAACPAMHAAYKRVFDLSGIDAKQLSAIDIYSCFPIVVAEAKLALGLDKDDTRPLSMTGGLPYFGGPGNNYSMHGIVAVSQALRNGSQGFGLVAANGGFMDKHALGIYSCRPGWQVCDSRLLQQELDDAPSVELINFPDGPATIESYTVSFVANNPNLATVVGRLKETGERFIANVAKGDEELFEELIDGESIGKEVAVMSFGKANQVASSQSKLRQLYPPRQLEFRDVYEFIKVDFHDRVMVVSINRPEVMNALHPPCHEELDEVFDIFETDDSLWIAIITGMGDKAFCSGNDLKYSASGKSMYIPKTGFAGLTTRQRKKPLIAAVNGLAMGGGMEIALASDIVIADQNAVFALPEVKVGLIAGAGGVQRLTRQIPLKQAMDLLITGRSISVNEAQGFGFVNQVAEHGKTLEKALEYAAAVCENSPNSVRLTMALLADTAKYSAIEDAVAARSTVIDDLFASDDLAEGLQAFVEKRKPRWTGH